RPTAPTQGSEQPLHAAALRELLHGLRELLVLLQQPADVLDWKSRAGRDPALAGAVDEVRIAPLARRHRVDDADLAPEQLRIEIGGRELLGPDAGQFFDDLLETAHVDDLAELLAVVLEAEPAPFLDLGRDPLELLAIDLALHLFDETDDVAHTENPRR